ncbi:MAG: YciI family protein [Chloroflexota bacterium]
MPKYAALIYRPEVDEETRNSPAFQQLYQAYGAFTDEIVKSGVMKGGDALHPSSTATTIRVRDEKVLTTDGPFAESKEQLGGFYLLECKDLDEAIQWAAKIPNARDGAIELRPVVEM